MTFQILPRFFKLSPMLLHLDFLLANLPLPSFLRFQLANNPIPNCSLCSRLGVIMRACLPSDAVTAS